MSEENVEVVRRAWEEFQAGMERGDPGAIFDSGAVAEDLEWILASNQLDGQSLWRGRAGFVEFIRTWTAEFDDWSVRLERLIDAGNDRVVVLTVQTATGKGGGVPVDLHVGQVVELEDGRQVRVTTTPAMPTPSMPPGCGSSGSVSLWTKSSAVHGSRSVWTQSGSDSPRVGLSRPLI